MIRNVPPDFLRPEIAHNFKKEIKKIYNLDISKVRGILEHLLSQDNLTHLATVNQMRPISCLYSPLVPPTSDAGSGLGTRKHI